MKKYLIFTLSFILITLIITPALGVTFPNPLSGIETITDLINAIINFLIFKVAPLVAMALIIYAGYLYMSSGGNEQKVKTAHKALIWALIGFAIVLIASSVPGIIKEILYE
jgi:Ni,Fe-hydrogenase I cytochrome b subunit